MLMGMAKPVAKLVSLLTPRRRWFQFSLKWLFVLVAIAAVPCIWLASKMERKRQERAAVAEIKKQGGVVFYGWQTGRKEEQPVGA